MAPAYFCQVSSIYTPSRSYLWGMVWGIVTVNDVTGNDVTGNDVTGNDVTGSKVTRSCIAKNAVTGTGNVREIISRVSPPPHISRVPPPPPYFPRF